MPSLCLPVILAGAFASGPTGATTLAAGSPAANGLLLAVQCSQVLPIYSIWNIPFRANDTGLVLLTNWRAVATAPVLVAVMCSALTERLKPRILALRESDAQRAPL